MNNPATQQIQVLKTVAEWADQFTCIRKIHVFGSFARGEEFSDIDIAVDYIDDVRELKAVQCYTEVNKSSTDLDRLLGFGSRASSEACVRSNSRANFSPIAW